MGLSALAAGGRKDQCQPMRRQRVRVKKMAGQLLFAEVESEFLILDCMLGRAEGPCAAVPVTLRARVPKRVRRNVMDVLASWADDASAIDVSISETARGTQVEISSRCHRIVLQP
jgi:hypothetical protein